MTEPYWQTVTDALLSPTITEDSEFFKKYITNSRGLHSNDDVATFLESIKGMLQTKLDEKRTLYALDAHRFILTENDMDDWSIFVNRLATKELQSKFWRQYRDHTAHQVFCFLLGAYIYENSSVFKDAFQSEYRSSPLQDSDPLLTGFYYQWATASVLHDFGYYLDVDKGVHDKSATERIEELRDFFSELDNYLRDYVFIVFKLIKGTENLSAEEEKGLGILQAEIEHAQPKHDYQDSDDFHMLGKFFGLRHIAKDDEDAWSLLDRFAASRSPRFDGVFSNYFRILATRGAPYGERPMTVWDYGIASAILFLKLSVYCFSYTQAYERIAEMPKRLEDAVGDVATEIANAFKKCDYSEECFWAGLVPACFAMAAHNLRDLTSGREIEKYGYMAEDRQLLERIGSEVLPIRMDDGAVAYLLMVVDQLQDWDRYPIVKTGAANVRELLEADDLRLRTDGNKVFLKFAPAKSGRRDKIREDLDALVADWQNIVEIQ